MARPFLETLGGLRNGRTLEELGDELATVVGAVKATHKPGVITLKLTIKPPKKGEVNYITIEDSVVTKVPKNDRSESVFFPTADNGLSKNDPRQHRLALGAAEEVDTETGEVIVKGSAA